VKLWLSDAVVASETSAFVRAIKSKFGRAVCHKCASGDRLYGPIETGFEAPGGPV